MNGGGIKRAKSHHNDATSESVDCAECRVTGTSAHGQELYAGARKSNRQQKVNIRKTGRRMEKIIDPTSGKYNPAQERRLSRYWIVQGPFFFFFLTGGSFLDPVGN